MTWYIDKGPDHDVILSSRIRLARNLMNYPFPHKLNAAASAQAAREISKNLIAYGKSMQNEFLEVNMNEMNEQEKQSLVEKHLISDDLTKGGITREALILRDESISIMINEEDHIRIQVMEAGMNLEKAYEKAREIAIYLEQTMQIGYHEKYGFTTTCPTNTGTGLRASVMMHLPVLVMTGKIGAIVENIRKMGYSVRGYYGENSNSFGNVFQISNQITLGLNEEELISDIKKLIQQIMEQERSLRKHLYEKNSVFIEDKVFRSLGILQNARILTSDEAVKLISDIRFGVALGIIEGIKEENLNRIMAAIGPASVQKAAGKVMEPAERDKTRAFVVRNLLKEGDQL